MILPAASLSEPPAPASPPRRAARTKIAAAPAPAPEPPMVPGWALPAAPVADAAQAAFLAGAALNSLDTLVRGQPAWAGAWRQRLALRCAASACRLAGRAETEAALRDAWALRPAGVFLPLDGPPSAPGTSAVALGPAGALLAAWRLLASRAPGLDAATLAAVAELLGLARDEALEEIAQSVSAPRASRDGKPAPFAAAAAAAQVMALRPDAELLAWWLADLAMAQSLRWPRPVPLLMAQAFGPTFRVEGGRGRAARLQPGDDGFVRALNLALAEGAAEACRLAGEISRRAARLCEVTPKLRAKGAPDAVRLLLDDDAVPGTLTTKRLSRFASRRLFERLEGFGAVRELTGRTSFRLYGL